MFSFKGDGDSTPTVLLTFRCNISAKVAACKQRQYSKEYFWGENKHLVTVIFLKDSQLKEWPNTKLEKKKEDNFTTEVDGELDLDELMKKSKVRIISIYVGLLRKRWAPAYGHQLA